MPQQSRNSSSTEKSTVIESTSIPARFFETKRLAVILEILIIASVIFYAYLLLGTLLITSTWLDPKTVESLVNLVALATEWSPALILPTFITLLWWLHASYDNLEALHEPMAHSAIWTVVGFFIPLYNWVAPCEAIKEVHQKSTNADSMYVGIWQKLWIAHLVFDLGLAVSVFGVNEITAFQLSLFVNSALLLTTRLIVRHVTSAQYSRHDLLEIN